MTVSLFHFRTFPLSPVLRYATTGILLPCLFLPAVAMGKAPDNPRVWKPDVRSVAVFKNGMGFFIRDGVAAPRDGWCVAGHVPPALFGTFAVYSLDGKRPVDVVGAGPGETVEFDGKDGPKEVQARRARLEACKGLKVALTSEHDGKSETVAGELIELTDEYAILAADGRLQATRLDDLKKLQVPDYPLRVHVQGDTETAEPVPLGMAYLRKGITWIPEYSLKIIDETTAELTLRGTLVNEAEDLIRSDVHFVVGVPSFLHAEYLTPIAVGQVIRAVGAALPPGLQSQVYPQVA